MERSSEQKNFDYLHLPEFTEWVLHPTDELDQYWNEFIKANPSEVLKINQTRELVKSLIPREKSLSESEVISLWNKIEDSKLKNQRIRIRYWRWTAAASIFLIMGLSGWFLSERSKSRVEVIDYHAVVAPTKQGNDIKLILSDQSEETFTSKEVSLKYNKEGLLEKNSGKQVLNEKVGDNSVQERMNQLVIPFGKKSEVELADGSRLWLNSGSRAIYPVVFGKDKREIFIEGECYLEVAHDASKPFFVVTDHIRVRVLGTKFNVSAYLEDETTSVVLVEGSVEAFSGDERRLLKPNQLLSYQKSTKETVIKSANVLDYISWKDGWMFCNKEKLTSIFTKLSRYYDVKVDLTDPRLNNMTLTGKLELKANYEDVLKVICTTAPLKYQISTNSIVLKAIE